MKNYTDHKAVAMAAEETGLSTQTIYRLVRENRLPVAAIQYHQVRGRTRPLCTVSVQAILEYIESQSQKR